MDSTQTFEALTGFDLMECGGLHRFRTQKLRDGEPIPPAWKKAKQTTTGYVSAED